MKRSGIYCFRCLVDGKRYVGQSMDVDKRGAVHFRLLRRGKHFNPHFQRAFLKYGEENFEFSILEEVPIELLDAREGAWIKYYRSKESEYGYNVESGGFDNRHVSEETRRKIAQKRMGVKRSKEDREKQSRTKKSLPLSERQLAQLEEIHNKRRGSHLSEEHCRHMSESQMGHPVSEETRRKIAKSKENLSPESRQRLSDGQKNSERACNKLQKLHEARIGVPLSFATRQKLSDALKGKVTSPEIRQKISASLMGHSVSAETLQKMSESATGKTIPPETRARMRESRLRFLAQQLSAPALN